MCDAIDASPFFDRQWTIFDVAIVLAVLIVERVI